MHVILESWHAANTLRGEPVCELPDAYDEENLSCSIAGRVPPKIPTRQAIIIPTLR